MYYHTAVVGPDLVGWLDRWTGDMFVPGGSLPQMPRLLVRPGQRLIVGMQAEGRLVAVVQCVDGTDWMLPFQPIDLSSSGLYQAPASSLDQYALVAMKDDPKG